MESIVLCFGASDDAPPWYLGIKVKRGPQSSLVALDLFLSQLSLGNLLACGFA